MRHGREAILMGAAAAVFVASTAALARGLEPVATWYYSLAWWSYIVFLDAWGRHRSPGLLLRSRDTARVLGFSVVIWASFEIYNFRLDNWHYIGIPAQRYLRWTGYAIAYATVLPAIFVTARAIERHFPSHPQGKTPLPSHLPPLLLWGGLVASVAPWIWPRYFFPLVWLGPTAFFAAVNYRLGGEGLLRDLEANGPGRLYRLLAAGAVCGLLWELWNFWARGKWVYDIPFFDWLRLFEMPLAGFLGFLPFALECHEMYWVGRKALRNLAEKGLPEVVSWLALAVYVVAAFWGIDRFTVVTFQR